MRKKKKIFRKRKRNGEVKPNLEAVNATPYEEIIGEVLRNVGRSPQLPKTLPQGEWSEQSLRVLSERYLRKNDKGEIIETPGEMCWRVAWDIASAEARWGKSRREVLNIAKEFYRLLVTHEFLPNSPTLMNAGTGSGLQYSACFVLPVEDSLVGIFDAIKYQALIHQTGGGTGFAFSRLRPRGSRVKSSMGTASGPVSFMRIFDAATNEIKQGGKRRGANMGILRVDHPDILEFIHCKEEGGITNFNISVAITDAFMEAYEKDRDYDLVNPKDGTVVGSLSARKVFDEIAEAAWRTGDPGLVFIDRMNRGTANPVPQLGPIESTNPCGEQPLYPFDSCNLGSIFLTYFTKEVNGKRQVDWDRLKSAVRLSLRFMDNVIEMNPYPLDEVRRTTFAIRRIGLGVGGWADMLVDLGIPYDSDEALKLGEEIMKVIQEEAVRMSQKLAEERGPFPLWPISVYKGDVPRRNATVTTIAPTGSISIIAGASSGIEPLFAIAYQHIVKDKHLDRTLTFFNPKFEKALKDLGIWTEELKEKVAKEGVVRDIKEVPEEVRLVFGTAHEIHHDWHIKHQAAFQKYTENAVSKTINMANKVGVEDVSDAYLLAWKTNCKGVTIFRDGSKSAQVLNLGVKEERKGEGDIKEPVQARPFVVRGATYRLDTPVGSAFVTINQDEKGEPLEVFINVGKAGSDVAAMAEALGRSISTSLRFRGNLSRIQRAEEIALQLAGIGGRRSIGFGQNKILSLPDAVSYALCRHLGFRVNGFVQEEKSIASRKDLHVNSGSVEATSNVAGAVMPAQFPAQAGSVLNTEDDHTTASAAFDAASSKSDLASALPHSNSEVQTNPTGDSKVSPKASPLSNKVNGQLPLEPFASSKIGDICPSCGVGSFVYQEGCAKCYSCGYSEC